MGESTSRRNAERTTVAGSRRGAPHRDEPLHLDALLLYESGASHPPANTSARTAPPSATPHLEGHLPPVVPFLVFLRGPGDVLDVLATVLDPLVELGRIAAWDRDPNVSIQSIREYTDPNFAWPNADVWGWIDDLGLIHLPIGSIWDTEPAADRQRRIRQSLHQFCDSMRYWPEWGLVVAQVQPPPVGDLATACRCGHVAADHPFRDCIQPDRTGLICSCDDFRTRLHGPDRHEAGQPATATRR